jgi:hypothetical protein
MLVQNNNRANPLTSSVQDLKMVLPVADQKTQQVSKGFFASLGQFAVKLLKTVVILATFPVSLPLMYLVSKIKNASTKASSLGAELNAQQKPNKHLAVASSTQRVSKQEEMLIPEGFFDEQPAQTTNEQPRSLSFYEQTLKGAVSGVQGAALGLAGIGLAAGAYWYGSGSSINAPLENATRPLANTTALGFPLENPLKGPQENSLFQTILHRLMPQDALQWAIKNFNQTAN